jgi:catechol 2,3-dioxygenase-like lactoylglutathione lyase family enzyme
VIAVKAQFTYVGIRVRNLERSVAFYTQLLDMKVVDQAKIKQTGGEVVVLQSEKQDFMLELNYYDKESPYYTEYTVGESLDHLAFKVDNLDKALEEARVLGHPKILEFTSENGRWAYIGDPNGIWIELF